MICRLLLAISLLLMALVFSDPDLCRNPKLDSISYIPTTKMWFFTSAGYYWMINETGFPPGPPVDKLPDGFKRGDAAFYIDYKAVCENKGPRNDQMVSVVEKVGEVNKLIGLDINLKKWSEVFDLTGDKIVGRANIDKAEQIDAIFTKGDKSDSIHHQIYVFQNQKFAAVDLKQGYCTSNYSKDYASKNVEAMVIEGGKNFDALATKDNQIYMFIDKKFWILTIEFADSKDGNIKGPKGGSKNTQKEFFKFPENCPEIPKNDNNGNDNNGTDTKTEEKPENDTPNVDNQSPDKPPEGEPNSGASALFLIVVIVVVVVIVGLVIGLVVWGMKGKPESEANKGGAQPAPKASGAPQKAAPKAKGAPKK